MDVSAWPAAFVEALELLVADLSALTRMLEPLALDNAAIAALRRRANELIERCDGLLAPEDDARANAGIRWIQTGQYGFTAHYVPVDTAKHLSELIAARACTWIYTSATLAVGDDF